MPDTYTQKNSPLRFQAESLGEDDLMITRLTGFEALSELFQFDLEFIAPLEKPIAFADVLGKSGAIALEVPGSTPRYFQGLIVRFAQGIRDDTFLTYSAALVPPVWLLTKRTQSRIFQHLSVPDILKAVFAGFKVNYQIQGSFYARDYCVQYRESDFAFASRLMEEEGLYYYFRHTDTACEMVIANTPQGHGKIPDPTALIYDETEGGTRDEGRVTAWRKVQEVRSGQVTLWDHCFELPDKNLEAGQKIQDSVAVGQVNHTLKLPVSDALEQYDYPGGYADRFDGIDQGGGPQAAELQKIFDDNRRTARLRIQEEAAGALMIEGTSTCRQLTSGHTFTLDQHFDADGDYALTRISHNIGLSGGGYRAGGEIGLNYQNTFQCIPLQLPFRPSRNTPKPTVQGTQTAVVVGPSGEEIFTDKYGRVKVQFHWDRQGKFDANSSCWIRVATIWAGKGWGLIHIPRIGQEVVVDFLEGDPDRPIVIGSVYNADQMPPGDLPKQAMVSGLVSRSTPQGGSSNFNGFQANDTKGSEQLNVQAEYDMATLVKNDDTQTILNNRSITVKGKQTEDVKGAVEETYESTTTTKVTGDVTENYDAKQTTTVKGDQFTHVTGGNHLVQADSGHASLHVNSGNRYVNVGAGFYDLIAATKISLTTGASSLVMESDGTITIKGVNITIDGSTKVGVTGGGAATTWTGGVLTENGPSGVVVTGATIKLNS
ncbi:MAG TPA: type VI secretion system tip protein TssI/VgrG [Gemmata sp.]|jgi:type VI secretion system secreted protein VgrG|nr:type VI secretion system tip protein TssI/VgrG [Gemmata sp.]